MTNYARSIKTFVKLKVCCVGEICLQILKLSAAKPFNSVQNLHFAF